MPTTHEFASIQTGAELILTQLGAAEPQSFNGRVVRVMADTLIVRVSAESVSHIAQLRYLNEFLVHTCKQAQADLNLSLHELDLNSGELTLVARPENRREFQRVEGPFEIRYEILESPEALHAAIISVNQTLDSTLEQTEKSVDDHGNEITFLARKIDSLAQRLGEALDELNAKVDFLIAESQGRPATLRTRRSGRMLELSGSGFSFLSGDSELAVGDKLHAGFEVCREPYQKVQCVGEVLRVTADPSGASRVSVHILNITNHDREKIVHFVFSVQRRNLRAHRDQLT